MFGMQFMCYNRYDSWLDNNKKIKSEKDKSVGLSVFYSGFLSVEQLQTQIHTQILYTDIHSHYRFGLQSFAICPPSKCW